MMERFKILIFLSLNASEENQPSSQQEESDQKERDEISIKLYKSKPSFAQYKNEMKRVAGHEFGG